MSLADHYTGEEAILQRSNVTLRHPVERGVVNQWSEMELVWEHAYERLRTNPEQQPVLVTESVLNPPSNRRRTVETFLETFRVPGIFVADTPSLSLYADRGGSTGLVLESGYSATYAVPVVKGEVVKSAVTRLDLGGNDLTVFLLRLVESRGSFLPPAKRGMFAEVKEKLCYVAMDFVQEEKEAATTSHADVKRSYNLAGDNVTLQTERFQCPESLFQPNWLRVDAVGVHQLVHEAVEKCPQDVHQTLYDNVLVTGGCTCFPGFLQRLEAELDKLCPEEAPVSVRAPDNPKTLAWRGGSEFALSGEAGNKWITLKEYQEVGDDIVERKRGIFPTGENEEDEKTHRDTTWHRDRDRYDSVKPKDASRNSSQAAVGSSTPSSLYRDRKVQVYPSATTTPSLYEHSTSRHSHTTTPGLRGNSKSPSKTVPQSTTPSQGSNGGSSLSTNTATPRLHSHTLANETRPVSPGIYDITHFNPTLPKTPELTDDENDDEKDGIAPLQETSKDLKHIKQTGEKNTDASNARKMSFTDFSSLRKLSLFDHLLDEVASFVPEPEPKSPEESGDDILDVSDSVRERTLLDKMKEQELLPGRGRSGLRRNETIDVAEMKKTTSTDVNEGLAEISEPGSVITPDAASTDLTTPRSVPVIEITTCSTPGGSGSLASQSRSDEPEEESSEQEKSLPRRVKFNFSE